VLAQKATFNVRIGRCGAITEGHPLSAKIEPVWLVCARTGKAAAVTSTAAYAQRQYVLLFK
jgi:hypothetical protein